MQDRNETYTYHTHSFRAGVHAPNWANAASAPILVASSIDGTTVPLTNVFNAYGIISDLHNDKPVHLNK